MDKNTSRANPAIELYAYKGEAGRDGADCEYTTLYSIIADAAIAQTREALQLVYDSLNKGQQKKLLKETAIQKLFGLYGVEV